MPDTTREHWTTDEELLEQYVLGRLATGRREPLEAHLRDCAVCQARVTDERLMTTGIRAAGRADLRRELAERLGRKERADSTGVWRWMAAAAVLVATVGVWRWLGPTAPPTELPPSISEQPAGTKSTETGTGPAPPPSPATRSPMATEERLERREPAALEEARRPEADPAAGAGARIAEAPREIMVDDIAPEVKGRAEDARMDASPLPGVREAWVEATVIAPALQQAQKIGRSKLEERAGEAKDADRAAPQGVGLTGPMPVQLRQMQQSPTALDRRIAAAPSGRSTVPVRITIEGDSLIIELHPRDPFSATEMSKAMVMRPKADSIVVLIGRELLGLRVPKEFIAR